MSKTKKFLYILIVLIIIFIIATLAYKFILNKNSINNLLDSSDSLNFENYFVNASSSRGQKVFRVCRSCHSTSKGGKNRVGPNLWNVLSRGVAEKKYFRYSKAIKRYSETQNVWKVEDLNIFLTSPKDFFPNGTSGNMNFYGLKKIQDRADVIKYLRSLDDKPKQ